jgi:hypothetical protein
MPATPWPNQPIVSKIIDVWGVKLKDTVSGVYARGVEVKVLRRSVKTKI